jgi:hypothetical protein
VPTSSGFESSSNRIDSLARRTASACGVLIGTEYVYIASSVDAKGKEAASDD